MLPRSRRVHRSQDFTECVRAGVRVGRRTLVVHVIGADRVPAPPGMLRPAAAGFIVSKAVGNSVVRHRVVRRLRHLIGPLLVRLPAGTRVAVRALPAAATATGAELAADLASALSAAAVKAERQRVRSPQ